MQTISVRLNKEAAVRRNIRAGTRRIAAASAGMKESTGLSNSLKEELIMPVPHTVELTLRLLYDALRVRLPETVESLYVYGSVALGAYIEGSSDIDFIAVVNRPLGESDMSLVAAAHKEVELAYPSADIMGAYISRDQLGANMAGMPPVPTYFQHELHKDGKGADLNPVTWRVLRDHGVCVGGEPIRFTFETSEEELVDYVIGNMNSYWVGWIEMLSERSLLQALPESPLLSAPLVDQAVEWCVLGMLRQLYTIREGAVTSKTGAGEYGLAVLPDRWHPLIREAVAIKGRRPEREYDVQTERLEELVKLLHFIHAECNRAYAARGKSR